MKWNGGRKAASARAERKRAISPERRAYFRAYAHKYNPQARYGITREEFDKLYDRLLISQNGKCALCERTPEEERYGRLNLDHCHETKVFRGLLCSTCNKGLGMLGDTVESIKRVLSYLKKSVP